MPPIWDLVADLEFLDIEREHQRGTYSTLRATRRDAGGGSLGPRPPGAMDPPLSLGLQHTEIPDDAKNIRVKQLVA